jgi:hypothetical protein
MQAGKDDAAQAEIEVTFEMISRGMKVLDESGYLDRPVTPADELLIEQILKESLAPRQIG